MNSNRNRTPDNALSFIKNAIIRTKNIGHNKFQDKLKENETTIETLNTLLKEKNDELELFKTNFHSLNLQLQAKNQEIETLNLSLNDTRKQLNNNSIEYQKNNETNLITINNLTEQNNKTFLDKVESDDKLMTLKKLHSETFKEYTDLTLKYNIIIQQFQEITTKYDNLNILQNQTLDNLKLFKELYNKQETENNVNLDILLNEKDKKFNVLQETHSTLQEDHITLQKTHATLHEDHTTLQENYNVLSEQSKQNEITSRRTVKKGRR